MTESAEAMPVGAEGGKRRCGELRAGLAALILVGLVSGVAACEPPGILEPYVPAGAPYDPPDQYVEWWAEVQECTGIAGSFSRLNFFQVAGAVFITPDFGPASGRWVPPHDLYIASAHIINEAIVKHEMVHDLLQGGSSDDPRFAECSGLTHA